MVGGVDYRDEVRLEHLLHTSGIADYFSDPVQGGKPLMEQTVLEPQKTWSPQDLLEATRAGQQARFDPGMGFHYSDSGFVLLGLVLEAIYTQPFEEVVHQRIFEPLGMEHSYFPFRTQPAHRQAEPGLGQRRRTQPVSPPLTVDWAGGGAACTSDDPLKFGQALMEGRLIGLKTFQYLPQPLNRFERVIRYGRGMMRLKFADFFRCYSISRWSATWAAWVHYWSRIPRTKPLSSSPWARPAIWKTACGF